MNEEKKLISVRVAALCFLNGVDPTFFSAKLQEIKDMYAIDKVMCSLPENTSSPELKLLVSFIKEAFGNKVTFYGKVFSSKNQHSALPIDEMIKELAHKSCKIFMIGGCPLSEESAYMRVKDWGTKIVRLSQSSIPV